LRRGATICSVLLVHLALRHQTNLVVTEAGGDSAREFLHFGRPLVLLSLLGVSVMTLADFWGVGDPFGGDDKRRL